MTPHDMPPPEFVNVQKIVDACARILAHHPAQIQGAALADLLAIWLAGHQPPALREALLTMQIKMVRQLITVNEGIIAARRAGKPERTEEERAVDKWLDGGDA